MTELHGKAGIVTGAGRGAGRAIALALAHRGVRAVICSRTAEELIYLEGLARAAGGDCLAVPTDIRDQAQVERLVAVTLEHFGRIDFLVNNAGIGLSAPLEETTLEAWREVLDTNLTGIFLCSRAVVPIMKQQRSGHIINIASGAGKEGYANLSAYCASKFGLMGFSDALGKELADHNIKVSVLSPGSIDTAFSERYRKGTRPPGAKLLRPEDVAEAVLFLLTQSDWAWTAEMNLWPWREPD